MIYPGQSGFLKPLWPGKVLDNPISKEVFNGQVF